MILRVAAYALALVNAGASNITTLRRPRTISWSTGSRSMCQKSRKALFASSDCAVSWAAPLQAAVTTTKLASGSSLCRTITENTTVGNGRDPNHPTDNRSLNVKGTRRNAMSTGTMRITVSGKIA